MRETNQKQIFELLDSVGEMVIATVRDDGYPQATTVCYVNDGFVLYFATATDSQKALNMARDPKVSVVVNRPFRFWKDISSLSAGGLAHIVSDASEYQLATRLLFQRFPEASSFKELETEKSSLYRIELEWIALLDYRKAIGHVSHFHISPLERQSVHFNRIVDKRY